MKKFIYLIVSVLFVTLYSCSNSNSREVIENSFVADDDVVFIDSKEKLMQMFPVDDDVKNSTTSYFDGTSNKSSNEVSTRAGVMYKTSYGYSNVSSGGLVKAAFNTADAKELGISAYTTYICEFISAKLIVPIPAGYNGIGAIDMTTNRGCGYQPGFSDYRVGYSVSLSAGQAVLITNITVVRYNILGQTLNIFSPKPLTSLNSIRWDYVLY